MCVYFSLRLHFHWLRQGVNFKIFLNALFFTTHHIFRDITSYFIFLNAIHFLHSAISFKRHLYSYLFQRIMITFLQNKQHVSLLSKILKPMYPSMKNLLPFKRFGFLKNQSSSFAMQHTVPISYYCLASKIKFWPHYIHIYTVFHILLNLNIR